MMTSSAVKRVTIKRQLQQFSVQDKLDAIQRVNEGESKASVARDIGVPESTLRGWCKSEEKLRNSCDNENRHSPTSASLAALADNITANGSLDLAAKRPRLMSDTPVKEADVDSDALWFWLRQQQQHMTGLSEQLLGNQHAAKASTAMAAAAVAAAAVSNTNVMADLNPTTGWFWRWYKRYGLNIPDALAATPAPVMTPCSSANRTPIPAHTSSLHAFTPATLPGPAHTASSIPTHLPMSPKDEAAVEEPSDDEDDEPPLTAADAVAHGEKFLRWLDCCSDPSITALQILQFRYLLNNVRACAARRAKVSK